VKTTKPTLIPSPLARSWPFIQPIPIVYIYKEIQLYPVADSSTWPFPIRVMNVVKFKQAMDWLASNNIATISTMGTDVDYSNPATQVVFIKFTDEMDVVAFTLQFGELMV
jgi:hypothetical protein